MAELKKLPIREIADHPDNPRLFPREHVVDAIAENLRGGEYPRKHAIHVRQNGETYETLSGHHRRRAAEKAGLAEIWAWVEDLDHQAALMELVLSNNQGELSPLEIGIHALKAVPPEKGGRGKEGGLSKYAKKIGRDKALVTRYRQAAEVFVAAKQLTQVNGLVEKAKHLQFLHALPSSAWPHAVDLLVKSDWSAEETKARVAKALPLAAGEGIDEQWQAAYLVPEQCALAVLAGTEPGKFSRLSDLATRVEADLLNREHNDLARSWVKWLTDNVGEDSWDIRKVQTKRTYLEDVAYDREHEEEEKKTVSVILADPPWQYDFPVTDNRKIENQYPTATVEEIETHIKAPWVPGIAEDAVLFLWATAPKLREALCVMAAWGFEYKTHAIWNKERIGMGYWFRGQHELLLVGTRGKPKTPDESIRFPSIFTERRDNKHSRKPECIYKAIETMFPTATKFEMYQREGRDGWLGGGNESSG